MKKWILISIGAILSLFAITGFMYSQGAEVIDDDIMYMVSHSEYWSGEEGQVIARLYDWRGDPITVDNCTVDIYYPDKTLFITGGVTDDSLQAATGTHFYNFTTPAIEGVYQYYATCNYNGNSRTVANSFHLSPALNFLVEINNSVTELTAQELAHYIVVTDNLTTIRAELSSNNANIDEILVRTGDINGTVNTIDAAVTVIDSNVDQVLLDIAGVNVTVNLIDGKVDIIDTNVDTLLVDVASVQNDTTYIRNNLISQDNITQVLDGQTNLQNNLTAIQQFCDTAVTSGSQLCLWVDQIQQQVAEINATSGNNDPILAEINATTHSTYDYMTGTLATNVNNIFNVVNRIETNTEQINATVNIIESNVSTVIDNQEDVVYMEVTS